jgi:superfamily II DNA or RNA helicase
VPTLSFACGDTVRVRDERWTVTGQTSGVDACILDVRGHDRSNLGARASFLLPFEIVEPLANDRSPRRVSGRKWRRLARATLSEATPTWASLRTAVAARISLLPFQLEPALAITRGLTSRILIADEVGLGKTIQAALIIAEVLARARHARVLIVAPASLKDQWQTELHERFHIDAWMADSVSLARVGREWGAGNPWTCRPVTITSIDFIKRPEVMRALEALVWDAIVFDEAHGLAGHSDRAAAANALARRARAVVLLTATPHSGDERAFGALCAIGDLDNEFPLLTFRRTRKDVGLAVLRKALSLRVYPTMAEREMHRALQTYIRKVRSERGPSGNAAHLAMTVLTRRACSSAWSLLRSIEKRLALLASDAASMSQLMLPLFESSGDEAPGAELAVAGLDDRDDECRRLEAIRALAARAQSGESKLLALARLLRRTREPAIVFTEYRDTLVRLASLLHGLDPVTLHGGLTPAERREHLHAFTKGTTRVLLATDAASEGLNLHQRCRLVINLELPWTPLRLEQRIGRVERIGQSRRVHAVHLLAVDTVEESFVAKLLRRTEHAADGTAKLRIQSPDILIIRAAAQAEAIRIARWRRLRAWPTATAPDRRPAIATVRKRHAGRASVWCFHITFRDGAAQPVWETVAGITTPSHIDGRVPIESIERLADALGSMLEEHCDRERASLDASSKVVLNRAACRERAIAQFIEDQRARLSSSLVQPGLFDRRAERALSVQTQVLEDALARCRTRLDEIESAGRLSADPLRLAFAVLRR